MVKHSSGGQFHNKTLKNNFELAILHLEIYYKICLQRHADVNIDCNTVAIGKVT